MNERLLRDAELVVRLTMIVILLTAGTSKFFSGGDFFDYYSELFQGELRIADQWRVSGIHYQRTSEAWLNRLDQRRDAVMPVLEATYGEREAGRWFQRWRCPFLMIVRREYHSTATWACSTSSSRRNACSRSSPQARAP